jgi:hypothetical protein
MDYSGGTTPNSSATDVRELLGREVEATFRSEGKDLYFERKVVHRRRSRLSIGSMEAAGWSGDSAGAYVNPCTRCAETSCRLHPDWRLASFSRSRAAILPRCRRVVGAGASHAKHPPVLEQILRFGQLEGRRTVSSVVVVIFWRMRGEVQ